MRRCICQCALGICVGLTLVLPQSGHGATPVLRRVDRYGDALPPGAVARLGTLRFVHRGLVSVALSPDGKVVASGGSQGKTVDRGDKLIGRITYKSGGATTTSDHCIQDLLTLTTIRLWDADKGTLIRELETPDGPVTSLLFGPRGRYLFAGCGRYLCKWDIGTGKKLWQQEGVPGSHFDDGPVAKRLVLVGDRLVSLHGAMLIRGVAKGDITSFFEHPQRMIRLWDPATGRSLPTPPALTPSLDFGGHVATVLHDIAVSPDGKWAAGRTSRAVMLGDFGPPWKYTTWRLLVVELATGKVRHTLPAGKDVVWEFNWNCGANEVMFPDSLAFSADGATLATVTQGEVALIQVASGRKRILAQGLKAEPRLAFVGATQLAARMPDGKVRAWDIASGKETGPRPALAHAFITAHKSRVAAIGGSRVILTDLRTGKLLHPFEWHREAPLVRFAVHARNMLLSGDSEGIRLWETEHWQYQKTRTLPGKKTLERFFYVYAPLDAAAAWEKGVYVREGRDHLELRDLRTDRLIRPLEQDAKMASWLLFFSASGNRVAILADDFFRIFDVDTGKFLSRVSRSHFDATGKYQVTLSPLGTYFARHDISRPGRVELIEVASGKVVHILTPITRPGKPCNVLLFHFSTDERTLFGEVHELTSLENGTSREKVSIVLWEVPGGAVLQEIVVDPQILGFWVAILREPRVGPMALSGDHRLVALTRKGGKDIEVWEIASGKQRFVLRGHAGPVVSLSFSPNGKYLASGSEDTTVLVWDLRRPLPLVRLKATELAEEWQTLTQPDAEKADRAIRRLAAAPGDTLLFLKEHLRPMALPDADRLKKLFQDLDSDDFKTRNAASAALEALGETALGTLEQAAQRKNSPEVQRRLKALLHKARAAARNLEKTERLRQGRSLEVLERIATPEAMRLLRELAAAAPGARLTQEARSVLTRLESGEGRKR